MFGEIENKISLCPHQDNWKDRYEEERVRLSKILCKFKYVITHVGSTCVPTLLARPTIDVLIGAGNHYDQIAIRDLLALSNLEPDLKNSSLDSFILLRKKDGKVYYRIIVTVYQGKRWNEIINFRNLLFLDASLRKEYTLVRNTSITLHPDDIKEYVKSKNEFIKDYFARKEILD